MYKEIVNHRNFVNQKLTEVLSSSERKELARYHNRRVRDFQHERLVHLIVTLFFALIFFASLIIFLIQPYRDLQLALGALSLILLVLELAYIRHYYLLENGVQSLYALTEKLGQKSD